MGRRARSADGPETATAPMSSAELLETSPFPGDLEEQLKAVPPRTLKPGLTLYLGAGVILVAGFVGGIQADKQWGGTSSGNSRAGLGALAGARAGGGTGFGNRTGGYPGAAGGTGAGTGAGAGQGTGQGAGSGGATFGTVKLVDGSTIYVTTQNGDVAVKTSGSTQIRITKNGKVTDITPGSTVIVQGATGSDGSVTATSVTEGGGTGRAAAPGGG